MNSVIEKAKAKGIISVKETVKSLHQEVKSQETTKDEFNWKRRMTFNKRSERCASNY